MHAAAAALHAEARATHARDGDRRADFDDPRPGPPGPPRTPRCRAARAPPSRSGRCLRIAACASSTEPSAGSVSLEPSASSSVTKPLGAVTTVLPGRLAPGASVLPAAEAWPLMCTTRASAGRTGIMDSGCAIPADRQLFGRDDLVQRLQRIPVGGIARVRVGDVDQRIAGAHAVDEVLAQRTRGLAMRDGTQQQAGKQDKRSKGAVAAHGGRFSGCGMGWGVHGAGWPSSWALVSSRR